VENPEEVLIEQPCLEQIDKVKNFSDEAFKTPAKTGCGISEMMVDCSPDKMDKDLDVNMAYEQCRKISFGPEQNILGVEIEVASNKNSKELDANASTQNKKENKTSTEKEKLKELLEKKMNKNVYKMKNYKTKQEKKQTLSSKELEKDEPKVSKSQKRKHKKKKNKNKEKVGSIDKGSQEYVPDNSWSDSLHK
jgi:hypothetical protein